MHGFVLLSASTFIYFTYQVVDDGLCDATQLPGLQRDPNKQLRYAQFIEHFYHVLDVPKIEGAAVQTERHCLLRCVKIDRCFSANTGTFHPLNGNIFSDLLPTDKYSASEKFKANHTFHHYNIIVKDMAIIMSFIKSILKSLVILAIWLALNGAIYSRIALFFCPKSHLFLSQWEWASKT